jgi:hypothetical protein
VNDYERDAAMVDDMLETGSFSEVERELPHYREFAMDEVQRATEVISPGQLVALMLSAQAKLDAANTAYREAMHTEADSEHDYRVLKAKKWDEAVRTLPVKSTAAYKESWVQGQTAAARQERDHAIANSKAEMERVRNIRQELSSLQSIANAIREEVAMARVGPDLTP